jgi:uncharacterized protein (TIGR02466 family)
MSSAHHRAQTLIQAGFKLQQDGQAVAAEGNYTAALQFVPEHPAALQLLGSLARGRGELGPAEKLLRRSLQAHRGQPHVWNNLGNLIESQGRLPEAQTCYREALGLKSDYVDALYNLARVCWSLGQYHEANGFLSRATDLVGLNSPECQHPLASSILHLQALLADRQDQLDDALAAMRQAIKLKPTNAALHHEHAVLLLKMGSPAESLVAHLEATRLGLDNPDAHYNRGNTLQQLGRLADAEQAYETALTSSPLHPLAHYDLARLRWRLGREDFDGELRRTEGAMPEEPSPCLIRANLLWRAEKYADAMEAFQDACRRSPSAEGCDGIGRCLVRLGRLEDGLRAHEEAVGRAPEHVEFRVNQAASLLAAGRLGAAEAAATQALALNPHHQLAHALMVTSLRASKHPRAEWLLSESQLLKTMDLVAPAGWRDLATFLAALEMELESQHFDLRAPIDQTLRVGTQTFGTLFKRKGLPALEALRKGIANAVDEYVAALPADPSHPVAGRRGQGWRFTDSWSSRLASAGFHTDHVHPHGWISGVFYVRVPDRCADTTTREGWLRFGMPDLDVTRLHLPEGWVRQMRQPMPGRLVLFPSMYWHGTTPFHSHQVRMSVAFDLLPEGT